jgi:putative ATP-binding cassette transporter
MLAMHRLIFAMRTFMVLALPYFRSEDRWPGRALLTGVIAAEFGLVYVAVEVARWNARFFNALEQRSWELMTPELFNFGLIVIGAILAGMAQYYFGQALTIRWRQWMTARYVGIWMAKGRHYRQGFVDRTVDNIHLRIANDVFLFIQRTHELGTGLLGSLIALLSFAYMLWGISAIMPLPLFGLDLSFPGYLIVLALAFAATGTLIGHWIGKPLIPLQFDRQRYESDFRFAIARVTDNAEPVALMGGEAVERAELGRRFAALVVNWVDLIKRETKLVGFSAGYAQVSVAVPTLIGMPAYLAGAIPLGTLIQGGLAFNRVEGAFGFFLAMYRKIAEWKAVIDRLAQFEASMVEVDRTGQHGMAIRLTPSPDGDVAVNNLVLRAVNDSDVARVPELRIAQGERVLVNGPSGSGKSCLLRAIAGIWRFGEGTVSRPPSLRVLALPQRRYFPLGTLRQALTYPTPAEQFTDAEIGAAMETAGISRLAHRLEEEADWSMVLSGGEQQRIGFARVLLHRPDLILLDEAVSTFEDADARDLYRILFEKLPQATVISVGRSSVLAGLHRRIFDLAGLAQASLKPSPAAVPAGAPAAP